MTSDVLRSSRRLRLRVTTVAAWALWAVSLVSVVSGIATASSGAPSDLLAAVGIGVAALSFATAGAILVSRLPVNLIGWLLAAGGLCFALSAGATDLGTYGLTWHPGSLPGAIWFAWLSEWIWAPAVGAVFGLVLVYPSGRLLSARWRPVAVAAVVVIALLSLATALGPWPAGAFPAQNPLGIAGAAAPLEVASVLIGPMAVVVALLAVVSLAIRYRRAVGVERAQLKWFVFMAAISVPAFLVSIATYGTTGLAGIISSLAGLVTFGGFALLPVAIGIAILRYRLYEIDLLVNRTAVYGSVTVVLVIAFGLANLALQRLAETVIGQHSDLIAAGLGVGAALAFTPLRRRIRPIVDRLLPSRAVLTLLFTDIVGSTERIVALGDERWRALLDRYRAAVRQELSRFGGHEINTAGDAFFATFERPMAGVRCAWGIRAAVRRLGLESRTGLHLGEVELRSEQVSGLAVHTAARVMAEAKAGEIVISDALRAAVAGDEVRVTDRGPHQLKGVPGEWQLFAVEAAGGAD